MKQVLAHRLSVRLEPDPARVVARLFLPGEQTQHERSRVGGIADRVLGNVPGYQPVAGGFFLWLPVPEHIGSGEDAAKKLWAEAGIQVLPGATSDTTAGNPGRNFIRVALVAPVDQTEAALNRLKNCLYQGG